MIELYGVARSRASRNLWLLGEMGAGYRHVPVIQAYRLADPQSPDAPQNTLSPDFLKLSPAGAIPVMRDGDLTLSESIAINIYLAKAYGGDLGPHTPAEEALMLQWALYGASSIEGPAVSILYVYGDGKAESEAGAAELTVARDKLRRPLAVMNAHLAAEKFMVGGRFTVADINMAEMIRYASGDAEAMAPCPTISAWLAILHERPAFKAMWAMRLAEPA